MGASAGNQDPCAFSAFWVVAAGIAAAGAGAMALTNAGGWDGAGARLGAFRAEGTPGACAGAAEIMMGPKGRLPLVTCTRSLNSLNALSQTCLMHGKPYPGKGSCAHGRSIYMHKMTLSDSRHEDPT